MTIADIIGTQADESVKALLAQGWEGGGASYDLGTYSGDEEALAEKLGRKLTRDECASLEHQIRRRLDAAIVVPFAFAAIGDDGRRPVVWGVGDTEEEALEDARGELREADTTSDLRTVAITAERRAEIEAGDVDAEGL